MAGSKVGDVGEGVEALVVPGAGGEAPVDAELWSAVVAQGGGEAAVSFPRRDSGGAAESLVRSLEKEPVWPQLRGASPERVTIME
ncbi:hypothetical protein OHA91_38345 [Streptomyces erythrochromogenes]|uniref:Uncharacterized protein n=1 Tax=Streptomyces erythrochromogenes TaxID=285574 RepID=A0ABZ1QME6_9ACTN|nr:hypothetical protein [Streptomyces erythrochromogenes]